MRFSKNYIGSIYKYVEDKLAFILIYMSFAYYLVVGIISPITPNWKTALFMNMSSQFAWTPVVWGVIGLTAMFMVGLGIHFQNYPLMRIGSTVNLMLWVWASISYVMINMFGMAIATAIPMLMFWGYNYIHNVPFDKADAPVLD